MESKASAVRFLGTTQDVTTCECCGRSDLKSTVALSFDDSPVTYYGVVCAARALSIGAKDVRKAAKEADDAEAAAKAQAWQDAQRAEYEAFQVLLDGALPHLAGRRFEQLQALGGYSAARAALGA